MAINMIYTSYFGNLRNLSKDIIPISICLNPPKWYKGLQYKKLAPKYWILNKYKQDNDEKFYIKYFYKEILDLLNPQDVIEELFNLTENKDFVLLCYESSDKFCHRHIVRDWFNKNNIECREWLKAT